MKPFIEDRNYNKYEFEKLTRRQKIKVARYFKWISNENLEEIENAFFELMKVEFNDLTREIYEDILDFNEEVYGFESLYELMGAIIEDVFTQVGGETKPVHPYLQAIQAIQAKEEETAKVAVEKISLEEKEIQHQETPINPIYY